jgi:uncharacterized protein
MSAVDKNQISTLIRLEAIENERRIINSALEKVAQQYEILDVALESGTKGVSDAETHLADLKKSYRAAESDLQLSQSKIESSQEKLRAVKNNKEYQSILKEIDDMKKAGAKTEDMMLNDLEAIDGAKSEVASQKEAYANKEQEIEVQKAEIGTQEKKNLKRLTQLDKKFAEISKKLDEKLINTYNRVKQKQNGRAAIVAAKDSVCNGCHLNIPPQMYNELQRCDCLEFCPHCQRIIYWGGLDVSEN